MVTKTNILIIDDNDRFRQRMAVALAERGLNVFEACNLDQVRDVLLAHTVPYAILDLKIKDENGLNWLPMIKDLSPQTEVVIVTGYGSITTATSAIRLGAKNYIPKPVDADQVLAAFNDHALLDHTRSSQDLEPPSLAMVEWEHIQKVLADCQGNITRAAEKLGIHRRSLQRKLQRYAPRK